MSHLNYNHLYYFWMVASRGSIVKAAESLHVTPQTVSGQIRTLEARLGSPLFRKVGRKLVLTDTGRMVRSYAQPMFELGRELTSVLKTGVLGPSVRIVVGIELSVPQPIAYQFLAPSLRSVGAPKLVSYRARHDVLIADLCAYDVDIVITESPCHSTGESVRNVEIDSRGVSFFCARGNGARLERNFPLSFEGAPFLSPVQGSEFGKRLEEWCKSAGVDPAVVAQFEEHGLMCEAGEEGLGIFAQPTILEDCILSRYRVDLIGRARGLTLKYYAVERERKYAPVFKTDRAPRRPLSLDALSAGRKPPPSGSERAPGPHYAVSGIAGRA